ncbi:GntR family transcriptional regulator [Ktedonosporobacter rubrisoli]|uniref:GntR family transcriptional regulator n=1 Tax=Ktedonosporobacter rubrisoli TaxID=2509675 RepID=A0A4P6JUD6_KTERU|nr:GntR family transcriptional regulator [Ktedonosporobacter rubrisoli]QBD79084.1 GntR family transcriptional regulator [Ktedonosporobacter rubrisoli]
MQEQAHYRAVSKISPVPLYYQVESDMRERIKTGVWKEGEQLPSEGELCALYKVSRTTLRQAISALVDEGLIVRERGRGSFIRGPVITAGTRGLSSFSDEMAAMGMRSSADVLSIRQEAASVEMARRLHIAPGEALTVIKRLRYANEKPIGIQIAHLTAARFPGLEQADLSKQSLYQYLEEKYGTIVAEAEEIFATAPITGKDAQLLNVSDGACGFYVERLTFDQSKEPFEFVTSIMRGDRYRVQFALRATRRPL